MTSIGRPEASNTGPVMTLRAIQFNSIYIAYSLSVLYLVAITNGGLYFRKVFVIESDKG